MTLITWLGDHVAGLVSACIAAAVFWRGERNRKSLEEANRTALEKTVGSRLDVLEMKERDTRAWIDNHSIDRAEWEPVVSDVAMLKAGMIGQTEKLNDIEKAIIRLDAKLEQGTSLSNMAQAGLAKELGRLTDKVEGARTAA